MRNFSSLSISNEDYPTVLAKPNKRNPEITIFTYGANTETAINLQKKLFLKNEKFAQVVIFSKITDIPKDILKMTTENINEVIIVEDGTPKYGWGSDFIANICSLNNHKKDSSVLVQIIILYQHLLNLSRRYLFHQINIGKLICTNL